MGRVALAIILFAITSACAMTPRAADGPRPSIGANESFGSVERPSVITVARPSLSSPPKQGWLCGDMHDAEESGPSKGICTNVP